MESGNVAPAPVSGTPLKPPLVSGLFLPHAAASSRTATTTATALMERVYLGIQPPCLGHPRSLARSPGGVSRRKRGGADSLECPPGEAAPIRRPLRLEVRGHPRRPTSQ